jgi:p-aminobenzoyl-glutamate transporter AbgT
MSKNPQQRKGDQQDNKRVFRWGVAAVIVLILAALIFNSFIQRPVAQPSPSAAGTPGPASTPQPLGAGSTR